MIKRYEFLDRVGSKVLGIDNRDYREYVVPKLYKVGYKRIMDMTLGEVGVGGIPTYDLEEMVAYQRALCVHYDLSEEDSESLLFALDSDVKSVYLGSFSGYLESVIKDPESTYVVFDCPWIKLTVNYKHREKFFNSLTDKVESICKKIESSSNPAKLLSDKFKEDYNNINFVRKLADFMRLMRKECDLDQSKYDYYSDVIDYLILGRYRNDTLGRVLRDEENGVMYCFALRYNGSFYCLDYYLRYL